MQSVVDCLRVSVTDRCNLGCVYCMPAEPVAQSPSRPRDLLHFDEIVRVVRLLRDHYGLQTVRLTGGEPLVRPHIAELARMLAQLGIDDLALTTNGQRLAELAKSLRRAGVTRVNLSLDSLDPARFSRLTRGGRLERTLAGIDAARAAGFRSVKINTVVLRGENDAEVCDLVHFAIARGLEIRFLELMAIGVAADPHPRWFVPSDEVMDRLKSQFRLIALADRGDGRTRPHVAEDAHGRYTRVGFISPETQPFCAACRRLRLTADGRLLACLMHSTGPSLLPLLRRPKGPNDAELDHVIRAVLATKPTCRDASSPLLMAGIGG